MTEKNKELEPPPVTRRQFLILEACLHGADVSMAQEAVASTALAHPEWDMDELLTLQEWRAR